MTANNTFCILPWIHVHTWPDGTVLPCCLTSQRYPVGNLTSETLDQVWNGKPLREIRTNMLAGKKTESCKKCYEFEAHGINSFRLDSNSKYLEKYQHLVDSTDKETGTVKDINLVYWDTRFSNLCNFKCRTCGPELSSSWYSDAGQTGRKVIGIDSFKEDIFSVLEKNISTVEEIYFAGGEPLIMPEHYRILELLIKNSRQDVKLRYNTNLSKLTFNKKHVFDYWKEFEDLEVSASIDAIGTRAEYVRHGTRWTTLDNNLKQVLDFRKSALTISVTVQLFNIFHLPEMLDYFDQLGISQYDISMRNILMSPAYYSIAILDDFEKEIAKQTLTNYLSKLSLEKKTEFSKQFNSIISYMSQDVANAKELKLELLKSVKQLDSLRGEDIKSSCKEIFNWLNKQLL